MSLAVELALARCVSALGKRVVYLSDRGVGSPLLSGIAAVERMALRPLGGFRTSPVIRHLPPVHLVRDHKDAERILRGTAAIIDGDSVLVSTMRRTLRSFRDEEPEIVRIRGISVDDLDGMTCVLSAAESGDAIWLRNDLREGELSHLINGAADDEFDELSISIAKLGEATGLRSIRYSTGHGEVYLVPPTALDSPDARQLDEAVGAGRAVFDVTGSCALLIPHLSFAPIPFGFSVTGLPIDAPDPSVSSLPGNWRVETDRKANTWRAVVIPDLVPEASAFELVLPPEYAGGAVEVTDIWTGIRRKRATWEAWDEAEAQLDLEQSW